MSKIKINSGNLFVVLTVLTFLTLVCAYGLEAIWDLKPCSLCMYQRYISWIIVFLGVVFCTSDPFFRHQALLACFCLLILNGGFAVFQVLVEQHIIPPPDGCATGMLNAGNIDAMRKMLLERPFASCDQVQWSFLGISIAAYHGVYCFLCAGFVGYFLWQWRRRGERV